MLGAHVDRGVASWLLAAAASLDVEALSGIVSGNPNQVSQRILVCLQSSTQGVLIDSFVFVFVVPTTFQQTSMIIDWNSESHIN